MVVFTCNNCGEALQKPKVAKHYQFQCRSAPFLTCVDCFKDFRGEEYVAHTKCITEAERYGGKDYVPKPGSKKGERKQEEWINVVNNLLNSSTQLSNAERGFLTTLSKYDNIPRKKKKFINFVHNALGNRTSATLVESVWKKMETAHATSAQVPSENQQHNGNDKQDEKSDEGNEDKSFSMESQENIAENQNNENICKESQGEDQTSTNNNEMDNDGKTKQNPATAKQKKLKKRVISETGEEQNEEPVSKKKSKNSSVLSESSNNQCESVSEKQIFEWKSVILDVLQTKGEISLKKLQKKVVSQYMTHCMDAVTQEKASSKFNKKLKKLSEITIVDNKVKLA